MGDEGGKKNINGIILLFLLIIFVLTNISLISAVNINQNVKMDIDIKNDLVTEYVSWEINLPPDKSNWVYPSLSYYISSPENLKFEQTGGKRCSQLDYKTEISTDNPDVTWHKIICAGHYSDGDFLELKITHKCDCVQGNSAVYNVFFPYFQSSKNMDLDLDYNFIFPSREYHLSDNNEIAGLTTDLTGKIANFKVKLTRGDSISNYYGKRSGNFKVEKNVDFSSLKELKGDKYTILYPINGFDEEVLKFKEEVEKIIPFVEKSSKTNFTNILIRIVPDKSLGNFTFGNAFPDKEAVNITIEAYDRDTVPHEICHLREAPFAFPSWFSEGQANNCARQYYESQSRFKEAKAVDEEMISQSNATLTNYNYQLRNWSPYDGANETYGQNLSWKGYGDAYFLIKNVFGSGNTFDVPDFIYELKSEFYDNYSISRFDREFLIFKGADPDIANDVLICRIASLSGGNFDAIGIFKKYGFNAPADCDSKINDYKSKMGREKTSILVIIFAFAILTSIIVGFIAGVVFLVKKIFGKKGNPKKNAAKSK